MLLFEKTQWSDWSEDYISSPYFNLDSSVLDGNHEVATFNYKACPLQKFRKENLPRANKGSLDEVLPENFDTTFVPSDTSILTAGAKCRDLMHILSGYTYNVTDVDAFATLEGKLTELV